MQLSAVFREFVVEPVKAKIVAKHNSYLGSPAVLSVMMLKTCKIFQKDGIFWDSLRQSCCSENNFSPFEERERESNPS